LKTKTGKLQLWLDEKKGAGQVLITTLPVCVGLASSQMEARPGTRPETSVQLRYD
jgi:hypothetical protein